MNNYKKELIYQRNKDFHQALDLEQLKACKKDFKEKKVMRIQVMKVEEIVKEIKIK